MAIQPPHSFISRRFVQGIILTIFMLSAALTVWMIIQGITADDYGTGLGIEMYLIVAGVFFLASCVFLSFLIIGVLKVYELERLNESIKSSNKSTDSANGSLLNNLNQLLQSGILTQEEYQEKRAEIIKKI